MSSPTHSLQHKVSNGIRRSRIRLQQVSGWRICDKPVGVAVHFLATVLVRKGMIVDILSNDCSRNRPKLHCGGRDTYTDQFVVVSTIPSCIPWIANLLKAKAWVLRTGLYFDPVGLPYCYSYPLPTSQLSGRNKLSRS